MKKSIKGLIALLPALLVFFLIINDPFYSLDAMLCDLLFSHMNGTGDTIKLITVDEETLSEYGPISTWSREKSAELIDVLFEDVDQAPAVLAFDFMFIGDGDAQTDNYLAEAAKKAGRVVTATNLVYRGKTQYNADGTPYFDKWNIETEERTYDALDDVVSSGFANVQLCKDGFVRTMQVSMLVSEETRYSFAAQVYRTYMTCKGNTEEMEKQLAGDNQKQFFYSGKPGEFIHYSLKDVLDGTIPTEAFSDSIVLVGAYAPGLSDSYHSSAKRGQDMYGVEINANIVRALMTGKTATRIPALIVALFAAIVLFLYTYAAREMNMYPALLVGVWVLLGYGIIGRIMSSNGHLMSMIYLPLVCLVVMVWIIIEKYVLEYFHKRKVLNTFRKYMAPQVIDNMAKDGDFKIELGGQKRHVAVLFVDIRGFTSMSESLPAEEVVQILNQYLSLTTACVFEHGGMLDKFIGDATMAIFNAPNDQEDYVYKAVLAGLAMKERGRELGEKLLKEHNKSVGFGIGIHIGDAVVGNIGCDTRMDYTAIGDTVNTASRIEGKAEKGELLISEETYELLKDRIDAQFKADMQLKGKKEPVKVYLVNGLK